jgi:TrmH family RNA methyltransferase
MQSGLRNIRIILVEPEGPFNIGSVARIMKNMGVEELALVKPAEYDRDDAYRAAVGARELLDGAMVFDSLTAGIRDANLVVGTTRRAGKLRRLFCSVEELPERVFPVAREGKVAILFGRERDGLTNQETDLCNILVNIPANESFPSLNLSHAVAVVCYKLFVEDMISRVPYLSRPVANAEVEGLLDYIECVFADLGFFTKGSPRYVVSLFRQIFGRALLDEEEVQNLTHIFHRLHGLCREKHAG